MMDLHYYLVVCMEKPFRTLRGFLAGIEREGDTCVLRIAGLVGVCIIVT